MIFGGLAVLLATFAFEQHHHHLSDATFHAWCEDVGIETVSAQVRTTVDSVAGRGVFATEDVEEGSAVIRIPEKMVLHDRNAAYYFPCTSASLVQHRAKLMKKFRRRHKWFTRIFNRRIVSDFEFADPSDWWQAELTLYCMEIVKAESHPWKWWISQWSRNDPMQRLHEKRASFDNSEAIDECVSELQDLLPEASSLKIRAAVDIRLRRLHSLKRLFGISDEVSAFDPLYGLLISRALELGDQISGVIPGFDMINHCPTPNLAVAFDGSCFEMIALRSIAKDEELFVRYTRDTELTYSEDHDQNDGSWDEDSSIWTLVQWGIPEGPKSTVKSMNAKDAQSIQATSG